MNASEKYPIALRMLHWLMAIMILGLLAVGLIMTDIPRTDPLHSQLYNLHKSFGITVLGLAILRVIVRLITSAPPLPAVIKKQERILAHIGHLGLYFFMFAIPLSGIIMTNSYGFSVNWFSPDFALPRIIDVDRERGHTAEEIHEFLAYALMGLIALHVLGALKHYVMEKLNLFKRMW